MEKQEAHLQKKFKARVAELGGIRLNREAEELENQANHQNIFRFKGKILRYSNDIGKPTSLIMLRVQY